jgi:hypothetical protein
MQFDCGVRYPPLTERDRRLLAKWRRKAAIWLSKREHKARWHSWYAWFPVRLADNDCRWLERIERRIEYHDAYSLGGERERHYRKGAEE